MMDTVDYNDELARTEFSDEQINKLCAAVEASVKVRDALEQKTNQELGKLLIEHVQGNMSIFSPQYELIGVILERLGFDEEKYCEEEDEKEAENNIPNTSSN